MSNVKDILMRTNKKKSLEMNNCLRSHLLTRDKLLCDKKCYTIFPQRFERNQLKYQWLCIAIVINSYHVTIFYSHYKFKKHSICFWKKNINSLFHVFQINIHNFWECIYCKIKKGKEFVNNVIKSMWSISIDHMGFWVNHG